METEDHCPMCAESLDHELLKKLDESGLRKEHLKTMVVAGMGFFTDAYLLFILTIALPVLNSVSGFNIGAIQGTTNLLGYAASNAKIIDGLITSAALFGAFAGAFVFGHISDRLGRKVVYGLELGIMIVFTLVSAFSINYQMLVLSRFLLGIGVGGDYPISSTIMSEYSSTKHRGKLIGLVFSMQGLGLLAGALVGLVSIYLLPLAVTWRFMLAFGAVPALYVVFLRRKLMETPRFSLQVKGDVEYASKATETIVGTGKIDRNGDSTVSVGKVNYMATLRKYLIFLIGTSVTWFIFDMAFYGTTLNNSLVLSSIGYGSSPNLRTHVFNIAIGDTILAAAFAVPGYYIAVALVDTVGRKSLQWIGFAVMAFSYLLIGLYYSELGSDLPLFILVFGLSYLFANIGPNTTTFILPTELFPTQIRSTAHGIASSIAKLGAGIFTFLFLILQTAIGSNGTFLLLSSISVIGAVVTLLTIRETKGLPLEVSSQEPSKGIHKFKPQ